MRMITEPFVLQEKTLGELIDENAARYPEGDAVIYVNQQLRQTWASLKRDVEILARGLIALGVQNGDRVAIWATNDPHWITLMFACSKIGAVLLPINTSYRKEELRFIFEQSDTNMAFIGRGYRDHDFINTLYSVVPELATQDKEAVSCAALPEMRKFVFFGDTVHPGMYTLTEVMGELAASVSEEALAARVAEVRPHDVTNMQFTSGTTGFPKGVMLSHVNILNNGFWIGRHQNFSHLDRVCLPVPFFHCFGCVLGIMACMNHASAIVVVEYFEPRTVLVTIEEERCTAVYGVPTMYLAMLEHKIFPTTDVSTLRTGIMAGSVCPEPLMRRAINEMNMREITICYGLTESSPVMTQTHADEEFSRRVSTVGRAMPGVEVRIVDPATMEEVPRGAVGEVVCRGYNIMKGYYKMPKETAEAVSPEGWLRSGDLGKMDDEGYVIITGRNKDMIVRGGENIYPREIEEFFSAMPKVFDIQVVAVPSYTYGEEVAAFIIPRNNETITYKDLRAFAKGRIAWQKVPRHIQCVAEFPLTASGKIQKYLLREQAARVFSRVATKQQSGPAAGGKG